MLKKKNKKLAFDRENRKPVVRCSICTGEQVAGFKDIHTGKFQDVMLIKNQKDLHCFMEMYGIDKVEKDYWRRCYQWKR
ncbi:MAG: aspartate dehydrogenase [Coprococcus sp.]|nr:aspartate dehydrogenase [Coprococcus sp.]